MSQNEKMLSGYRAHWILPIVDGMEDINPLYRDRDYARQTKYGQIIAPPTFLETVSYSQHPEDIPPGVEGFLAGFEWEYFNPVCEGDEYTARIIYPSDVAVKSSRFAGQPVIISEAGEMMKSGKEITARYKSRVIFMEGGRSQERGTSETLNEMPEYSRDEIDEIHRAQDEEVPSGSDTRYWEDVVIGEALPPVVRGPYTLREKLAWFIGKGNPPLGVSDRLFRLISMKHNEKQRVFNPELNIYIRPLMFDVTTMSDRGVPRTHDAGAQRNAWRNMVLSNWTGDDGFIWKSKAEIRGFNQEGDVTWCRGKVIDKYLQNDRPCVDIKSWCENQRQEVTMPGESTVILPSREHGPVRDTEPSS